MYSLIEKFFSTCTTPNNDEGITKVITRIRLALEKMAVVNYPYETNFMAPLPAWPVKAACNSAINTLSSSD
jgi:lysosomal Pro-X carboxypeptidase